MSKSAIIFLIFVRGGPPFPPVKYVLFLFTGENKEQITINMLWLSWGCDTKYLAPITHENMKIEEVHFAQTCIEGG